MVVSDILLPGFQICGRESFSAPIRVTYKDISLYELQNKEQLQLMLNSYAAYNRTCPDCPYVNPPISCCVPGPHSLYVN